MLNKTGWKTGQEPIVVSILQAICLSVPDAFTSLRQLSRLWQLQQIRESLQYNCFQLTEVRLIELAVIY